MGSEALWASQVALEVKDLPANAGHARDTGSIPGSERSLGGGHGNPLQYSFLESLMDKGPMVGYSPSSWTRLGRHALVRCCRGITWESNDPAYRTDSVSQLTSSGPISPSVNRDVTTTYCLRLS